jgi:hypothetical protein
MSDAGGDRHVASCVASVRGRKYREFGWRKAKCQKVIEKASFKCPTRQAKKEKAKQSGFIDVCILRMLFGSKGKKRG